MEFSSKQLQKHNQAVKLQCILTFTFWTVGKRYIPSVHFSSSSNHLNELKQSSFSTNRISVKLPREVTLLLTKSISFQFHFCQFLRKIGTLYIWSSVVPAPCWNFGANLIWKWGCALGQVSWPLCLFIFAFFCGFRKISWKVLGMNKTAEKKTHRKKHGMDFSAVWIIWNHVSLKIFDFKPVQVVELERQSPSKAVQDGTNNEHCHCS